jgi:CheY-like chemotaxis protein
VVLGNIGFLERDFAAAGVNSKLVQRLSYMRAAAERGAKLTDQLLSFSRRQRLEPRALDLNETVAGMRDLLQSTIGGSINVQTKLHRGLWPALGDPTQLELAVLNLAINARDAMQVGGSLTVETSNVSLGPALYPEDPPAGDYVAICVTDSGSGMTDEIRAKVFEPFFTTKEIGKGSGLGLSQVLGFAKQSGGGVRIESRQGQGTSVFIYLPRSAAKAIEPEAAGMAAGMAPATAGTTILLVDDDQSVREITGSLLKDLGYTIIEAGSGGAALDLLEREPAIDLLLLDFAMPGMNGAEVARQAYAKRPNLPILFVTGFADRAALVGVSETHIIGKPFVTDELANKVSSALAGGMPGNVVRLRR